VIALFRYPSQSSEPRKNDREKQLHLPLGNFLPLPPPLEVGV
jgi:hypothetical protein